MQDNTEYFLTFLTGFGLIYIGLTLLFYEAPGNNLITAVTGALVGGISVAVAWIRTNGMRRPDMPQQRSLLYILIIGVVVVAAAMPLPAGAAPDQSSRAEKTCNCLGVAVTAEATPRMMDVDIRKYCYGIPHSCRPVQKN